MYIGRFAPSPTGPLHIGSLLTALASWCDARAKQGKWLLRIEDVDTTRTQYGAVDHIFRSLEHFGLTWDDEVVYQSQRTELYQQALQYLEQQHAIFWCRCSRSQLAQTGQALYTGTCRHQLHYQPACAARLCVAASTYIQFEDRVFGSQYEDISQTVGDFVIYRRDGLFAYQLAVVVDDALQGITHIVRGADLLDNTTRQIYLQQQLGYSSINYAHLPLIVNHLGEKLSKQTGATALDLNAHPSPILWQLLIHLGQQPPNDLQFSAKDQLLIWAIEHWQFANIPKQLKLANIFEKF
jgi:glutamyl-Q tRNA(Asp) synthetase